MYVRKNIHWFKKRCDKHDVNTRNKDLAVPTYLCTIQHVYASRKCNRS